MPTEGKYHHALHVRMGGGLCPSDAGSGRRLPEAGEGGQASGLCNVPEPIVGAEEAIRKPASGKVEDTKFTRSAGSDLIVSEARKATLGKPLLVFVGGSCTTVASAYLTDRSIVDRMIVFQIDGGGYNGSDGWAWEIAKTHCRFANWRRGATSGSTLAIGSPNPSRRCPGIRSATSCGSTRPSATVRRISVATAPGSSGLSTAGASPEPRIMMVWRSQFPEEARTLSGWSGSSLPP